MERITEKNLQALCDRINRATDSPMAPYAKNADGTHSAQVGNYHIGHAYGGVCLHRMYNPEGGITCPIGMGHVPKRELWDRMQAFLAGLNQRETV